MAFLGVELKDASIIIASVFIGIAAGSIFNLGNLGFLGIPVSGYFVNRLYIDWQSRNPRGVVRRYFFRLGVTGYSKAISGKDVVFVGDNTPTCIGTFKKFNTKESPDGREGT